MKKVIRKLLDEYKHSKPIIYSHIENQYPYDLFYDEEERFGILFTSFDYHYCFGNVPKSEEKIIEALKQHHKNHPNDDIILYGVNTRWDNFLDKMIKRICGTIDKRYLYELDESRFGEFDSTNQFIDLEIRQEEGALEPYPQASIYIHDELVSYARAYMLGAKEAELDVWTCEEYRQQGMAFDACLVLIEYLLKNNIKPNWTCWEMRESSHNLALKLGYELKRVMNCYIWNKDCSEL